MDLSIEVGKQAKVTFLVDSEHTGFEVGNIVTFVEMDDKLNQYQEYDRYHTFSNNDGLRQVLTAGEFEWLDESEE